MSTKESTSDTNVMGCRNGMGYPFIIYCNTSSNRGFAFHYMAGNGNRVDTGWVVRNISTDTFYHLHFKPSNNIEIICDDNIVWTTNYEIPKPLHLFCYLDNIINGLGKFKMALCKIYEENELVRDFIPCYRIADGEIGMYDLVTQSFFTNAGTGTFTKGPDV